MLINYWSSKVNSGVKALMYNKVGDLSFIVGLVIMYDYIALCYYVSVTVSMLCMMVNVVYVLFYVS